MTDDEDLQDLREQTEVQTRAQSGGSDSVGPADLEREIFEQLEAIERGETSKTLSVRDKNLTALIRALEETGKIEEVGVALQDGLGLDVDPDAIDRSELLRLAIRWGISEASPEAIDRARSAHSRHASQQF
jgi:hypothetical protein